MKIKVRKITNISKHSIPIAVSEGTTIYVDAGGSLEDVFVCNLEHIREFTSIEQDLAEVNPVVEGRVKLND